MFNKRSTLNNGLDPWNSFLKEVNEEVERFTKVTYVDLEELDTDDKDMVYITIPDVCFNIRKILNSRWEKNLKALTTLIKNLQKISAKYGYHFEMDGDDDTKNATIITIYDLSK